jgi:putative holliday junction resolvase
MGYLRILGLDVGDKRTGVAISDPMGMLASPLLALETENESELVDSILQLVKKHNIETIIIGLPISMDGTLGTQAGKVKVLGDILELKTPVPVKYRDERLTTVTAKRMLMESREKKFKNNKVEYDAVAAAVILQSYLNETHPMFSPPEEQD